MQGLFRLLMKGIKVLVIFFQGISTFCTIGSKWSQMYNPQKYYYSNLVVTILDQSACFDFKLGLRFGTNACIPLYEKNKTIWAKKTKHALKIRMERKLSKYVSVIKGKAVRIPSFCSLEPLA